MTATSRSRTSSARRKCLFPYLTGGIFAMTVQTLAIPGFAAPTLEASAVMQRESLTDDNPRGKSLYAGACVSCHGWTGVSPLGYATLTDAGAVNDPTGTNVAQVVLSGRRKRKTGEVTMPAFASAYSDTEIAALANYVTARFGAAASHLGPSDVAGLRQQLTQD